MKKKQSKQMLLLFGALLVILGGGVLLASGGEQDEDGLVYAGEKPALTVYKSPSCGCCGNYVAYLRREGYDVEVIETNDMNTIKEQYGVPMDRASCHTTIVGDEKYIVEGHVPMEAVTKLLVEAPDVKGIGMAGMPVGSPGMPGAKRGPFDVYSFDDDGSVTTFTTL